MLLGFLVLAWKGSFDVDVADDALATAATAAAANISALVGVCCGWNVVV